MNDERCKAVYQPHPVIARLAATRALYQRHMTAAMGIVLLLAAAACLTLSPGGGAGNSRVPVFRGYGTGGGGPVSRLPAGGEPRGHGGSMTATGLTRSGYIPHLRIDRHVSVSGVDAFVPDSPLPGDGFEGGLPSRPGSGNGIWGGGSIDDHFPYRARPMWDFNRGNPLFGGNILELPLSRLPHLHLAPVMVPEELVRFFSDTAVVAGWLTLHATGRVTLEIGYESHPVKAFSEIVQAAIDQSLCSPARDMDGRRISVRLWYRCLISDDGYSDVVQGGKQVTVILLPE